jgi:hypothetical protein
MPATQPYDERVFALIQYVAEGRFYTAKTRRPGPYPQSVPLRCVANSLDRFNIKRRLSKIPMSRQISFRGVLHCGVDFANRTAQASLVTLSAVLRRLYGVWKVPPEVALRETSCLPRAARSSNGKGTILPAPAILLIRT